MKYGRFFSLDKNKSDLENGKAVFNYRIFEIANHKEINSTQFPVYVYISPSAVYFELHANINDLHNHLTLFKIPLDEGLIGDTDFTDMLKEAYSYAFKKGNKNKLLLFLKEHICPEYDDNKSYSKLKAFQKEPYSGNKFLRKLILDFLFDLDQMDSVFNMSPNGIALMPKICKNPLFNAIVKKARFYYYQNDCVDYGCQGEKDAVISLLLRKAKDWNNIIRAEESEFFFHNSGWCEDVESEIMDMFRLKIHRGIGNLKEYKEEWDRMWGVSVNWLLKRFSFINAIKMFFFSTRDKSKKTSEKHSSKCTKIKRNIILTARKIWDRFKYKEYLFWAGFILFTASLIVLINLSSYLFIIPVILLLAFIIFACSFGKISSLLNLMLPKLFAIIMSTWIVLILNTEILKCFRDLKMNWGNVALQILIIIMILFLFTEETKKVAPFQSRKDRMLSSCWIIVLGLAYSLSIGIILSSFVAKKILDNEIIISRDIIERQSLRMDNCYSYLCKTYVTECLDRNKVDLYITRCTYVIKRDSALLDTIISGCDLVHQDIDFSYLDERWRYLLVNQSNHLRLMCLICYDISKGQKSFQNFTPKIDNKMKIQCLPLFKELLDYPLSPDSYFDSLKYLTVENSITESRLFVEIDFGSGIYIRYFPGFLIIFSFISMFMGIFLQVITENKKITEAI